MGSCCSNSQQVSIGDDAMLKSRSNVLNTTEASEEREEDGTGATQEITLRILQAKNLPKKDRNGKCDPYIIITAGEQKFQTTIRRKTLNPIWNDDIVIRGKNILSKISELKFDLYDWDRMNADEFFGRFIIDLDPDVPDCETPAVWYALEDEHGELIDSAEVQMQLQIRRDVSVISARQFSHILQLTVISGHNLQNMDWLHKGDPYVSVEVGRQVFRTKAVKNSSDPVWNESLYLFIDAPTQRDLQLQISVLDKDLRKDDHVGTGLLPLGDIIESAPDGKVLEREIMLQTNKVKFDHNLGHISNVNSLNSMGSLGSLGSFGNMDTFGIKDVSATPTEKAEEENKNKCGSVKILAELLERKKVEKEFFESLCNEFDTNGDGKLQKSEVAQMLTFLGAQRKVDEFMTRFDDDYDGTLEKKEVLGMLEDSQFQESEDAAKFILHHLKQDSELTPLSANLMSGFLREDLELSSAKKKTIQIRSRKTGMIVQEHVPAYVSYALKLMHDGVTGSVFKNSKSSRRLLLKMSKDKGKEYDLPKSKKQIPRFIRTHNLDTSILVKTDVTSFETFNDFFARSIRYKECRPMSENVDDILSPCDCRMMCFENVYHCTNFWIKGSEFSVEKLLGPQCQDASEYLEGGAFCIARMAPQDYHRFHWPVSGIVTGITHVEGALYTDSPLAVNQAVNVYTENKRCIIEIDSDQHGRMAMIVVAAAMTGSYKLQRDEMHSLRLDSEVVRGDVAGEFRFGGSTILLLFERKAVEFKQDLIKCSKQKMETLIEVRDTIGGIPGQTN